MDNEFDNIVIQNTDEEVPEVTVEFKLTEKDFYKAFIDISRNSKSPVITAVISSLVLAAVIFRFINGLLVSIPFGFIVFIYITLASLIFILIIYLFKYQARNNYNNNKEMRHLIIHKIYKDKIITITNAAFVIRCFDEIYKFTETASNFLLYTAPNQAIMIPKKYFNSEEDINKTKELFSKIPAPAASKLERTTNVLYKIAFFLIIIPVAIIIIVFLLYIILQFMGTE